MGRITRSPPKPKLKYPHEVSVANHGVVADWMWEEAARIGGFTGYQRKRKSWSNTVVLFDTREKADKLRALILRREREEELLELRDCAIAVSYRRAALCQHGVIWGLATGHIKPIVLAYRTARGECSTHGSPNWDATLALVKLAPSIEFDRGRDMVDAMLVYIEARHRNWFWKGMQGDQSAGSFRRY